MFYVVIVGDERSWCDRVYLRETRESAESLAKHQRKSCYAVVFDAYKQKIFEHGTKPNWEVKFSDYIH